MARALVSDARVIVFDEPTSSLSEHDALRLFAVIDRLRERGLAVIYISHFLEEVRRVARSYTVLRDGRSVASGALADISLEGIITHMVGRELEELFPRVPHTQGEPILELRELCNRVTAKPVNLVLHRGEVLGIAGLVGAGAPNCSARCSGSIPSFPERSRCESSPAAMRRHIAGSPRGQVS